MQYVASRVKADVCVDESHDSLSYAGVRVDQKTFSSDDMQEKRKWPSDPGPGHSAAHDTNNGLLSVTLNLVRLFPLL